MTKKERKQAMKAIARQERQVEDKQKLTRTEKASDDQSKEPVRRPKLSRSFDKRFAESRVGRHPNAEKELTDEQKLFSQLRARGLDPDVAGKALGWSQYKIETYGQHPLMDAEIAKWQEVFAGDTSGSFKELMLDLASTAALELKRRAISSPSDKKPYHELSEESLMQILDKALLIADLVAPKKPAEKTKVIEKRRFTDLFGDGKHIQIEQTVEREVEEEGQ